MNVNLVNTVKHALVMETVRKSLYQFFENRNLDLDAIIYPPLIRDINKEVEVVGNKIEIIPHVVDIDPTTNYVRIGWNLFVLGTNRMYLGDTVHRSLSQLDQQVEDPLFSGSAEPLRTPRQIVEFIVSVMFKHKLGRPGVIPTYEKPSIDISKLPSTVGTSYIDRNKRQMSTI